MQPLLPAARLCFQSGKTMGEVTEPAQFIFRLMVEQQPQFKTWVTDGCVYSLTPRSAKGFYEIDDVPPRAPMVDV